PLGGPGLIPSQVPFADDAGFMEMYEHARRLIFSAYRLHRKLAKHIKAPPDPSKNKKLRKFREGWEATRQMQEIMLAFMKVMHEAKNESETPPVNSDNSLPSNEPQANVRPVT